MEGDKLEHSFDVEIATEYGIVEAILLKHFQYWIAKNEANRKNYYDGYYWTYNSTKAFSELFPYLTQRKIQNALKRLRDDDIIRVGNYNENQYDRTLWYAFTKKGKCIMQKREMDSAKKGNGLCNSGKCTNTNSNQTLNTIYKKDIYGEFKNVFLTKEEYAKLKEKGLIEYINTLSAYIEQIGITAANKKYKSHYAVILNWSRRENASPVKTKQIKSKPNFDIDKLKERDALNDDFKVI